MSCAAGVSAGGGASCSSAGAAAGSVRERSSLRPFSVAAWRDAPIGEVLHRLDQLGDGLRLGRRDPGAPGPGLGDVENVEDLKLEILPELTDGERRAGYLGGSLRICLLLRAPSALSERLGIAPWWGRAAIFS